MKILALHCDYVKFRPIKKAIKEPEELAEERKKEKELKEVLVVLTAVEKSDEKDEKISGWLAENIKEIAKQVKAENIVLYPYAHLSPNLSSPDFALKTLEDAEKELKKQKFKVVRAPFGYYKEFELKCKGHPLSELSRSNNKNIKTNSENGEKFIKITGPEIDMKEKRKTQRDIISEKIERKHYILTPEGKEYAVNIENKKEVERILNSIGNESLTTYILYTEMGNVPMKEPPSIKEMQQQELVGYAPEADAGQFKFYPKGNLIFELLKEWAYEIAVNRFSCLQVETPVMYDWDDPEIKEQGSSFHERHYIVKATYDPERTWVMRFAGDFGLFKILKAAKLSHRNLPLRMYEFSKSFRYEQKGELSGLKRLRAFHMPDIHSFCKDINSGWDEYKALYKQYDDLAKGTGIKYAVVFRVVEEFYNKNKEQIVEMLKYSRTPALIETLSEMKHYWAVKHEFQGLDSVNGSTQLSTVQLDVKDAETYGIVYQDKDGNKKGCTIVHSSVGSIERWLYCILEKCFEEKKPSLPYWLSPTQVRICPISEKFQEEAKKISDIMSKENVRIDIEDRTETISKKISNAEQEWIPYIIVLGEKEIQSGKLAVRIRKTGKIENMTLKDLINKLKDEQSEMPWKPLPLPVMLSKRPIFFG